MERRLFCLAAAETQIRIGVRHPFRVDVPARSEVDRRLSVAGGRGVYGFVRRRGDRIERLTTFVHAGPRGHAHNAVRFGLGQRLVGGRIHVQIGAIRERIGGHSPRRHRERSVLDAQVGVGIGKLRDRERAAAALGQSSTAGYGVDPASLAARDRVARRTRRKRRDAERVRLRSAREVHFRVHPLLHQVPGDGKALRARQHVRVDDAFVEPHAPVSVVSGPIVAEAVGMDARKRRGLEHKRNVIRVFGVCVRAAVRIARIVRPFLAVDAESAVNYVVHAAAPHYVGVPRIARVAQEAGLVVLLPEHVRHAKHFAAATCRRMHKEHVADAVDEFVPDERTGVLDAGVVRLRKIDVLLARRISDEPRTLHDVRRETVLHAAHVIQPRHKVRSVLGHYGPRIFVRHVDPERRSPHDPVLRDLRNHLACAADHADGRAIEERQPFERRQCRQVDCAFAGQDRAFLVDEAVDLQSVWRQLQRRAVGNGKRLDIRRAAADLAFELEDSAPDLKHARVERRLYVERRLEGSGAILDDSANEVRDAENPRRDTVLDGQADAVIRTYHLEASLGEA